MSDIPPWLYSAYRANLRRNQHHKPHKGRNLHRLERILYFWPMYTYIRWAQRKRLKPANTTAPQVGAIFMPENEDA